MAGNQQFCLRWNNHQSTLISVFDNLLESGTLVDCTLAAEGQYLKAHKVVLTACSPFFEGLFSQHYEKHPIIILKDVTFAELKAMLDYMYRGEVNISQDQLGTFLKAAESLQIKGLTDNSGNGDLYRKPPPEPRRIIMPPISKSPGFPTSLVVEPRPPSVKMTNNNVDSPPRRKRRLSEESLPEAPAALVQPQVTVGEPPTIDDYLKLKTEKSDASVNNYDSGDENAPYPEEYDEEEMDLSKPGTSSTPNNHPPGGWLNSNQSNDNTTEDPPGGSQEGERHQCGCGRSYSYIHNLERHRRLECGKEAAHTCTLCDYRSKHKHNLLRHISLRHSSIPNHLLPQVKDKRGEKKSNKRNHGVFPCEKCGRTYVRKDSLQRHMSWECGKDPMFQCPFCPQKCKRKSHHIRHIQRQHKDMLELMEVARNTSMSPHLPQMKDSGSSIASIAPHPLDPNNVKMPQLATAPKSENDTAVFVSANS